MRAGVAALAVLLLLSVTWAAGSSSPFTPSVTLVERTFDRPSCSLSTSLHIHAASSGRARMRQLGASSRVKQAHTAPLVKERFPVFVSSF